MPRKAPPDQTRSPRRAAALPLRRQRAQHVKSVLNALFPAPPIPLHHQDSYTLLIAVLLSAQCTDERVNRITPLLFARAANPQQMRLLTVQDILDIIRPCGLGPAKAAAISTLSRILVEEHNGEVPADMAALKRLPGVGHKTASVVLSQAFGIPAFAVDTHIHRCAARWGLSVGSSVTRTEADLKELFDRGDWGLLHLQIIYFARAHCPALRHDAALCPICSTLPASAKGGARS